MKKWSIVWLMVGLVGIFAAGNNANAAEFSPALDDQLSRANAKDFVAALIILPNAIDIQALDDQLHVRQATKMERKVEVLEALHYNADQTQSKMRAEFNEAIASGDMEGYTSYWIENVICVSATKDFIESLRHRGDIRYCTEKIQAELIDPIRTPEKPSGASPITTLTLPPGIQAIGAYRVNTELGITGQGVLVANMDTGVDGNHPALAARWRGAGGAHPWYHCWKDILNSTQFPTANGDHGTHVMGTITGRAIVGADTQWIGCAPDAQWIADRCVDQGVPIVPNFRDAVVEGYQWFADPDSIPSTDDAPDVVQNSWGVTSGHVGEQCYDYWNTVITNCEATGVVITWSAGNEGTSGLRSPAIYQLTPTEVFAVGAVDATNYPNEPYPLASFSSQGPTPCPPNPGAIKPEVAAPGVNVYSCIPGGGYDGTYSGTSMAGPHVAGCVALMRQACPDCDPTTIKLAIMATAHDYGTPGEDNQYGAGFIDCYQAVLAVIGDRGRVMGTIRDASTLNPLQADVQVVGGPESTQSDANGVYWLNLPGDSMYTLHYSLYGYYSQDIGVTVVTDDTTYQDVSLLARTVISVFSEDFESGAPNWTHETPGGQWIDQWHLSTEQAYGGTTSYKCGDTGAGPYGNFDDALMTSPVISALPAEARLQFYLQIESELSVTFSDSAYDGGILEVSADGGAFTQVAPVGNYPKTFRWQSGSGNPATGPMLGQPCWAGAITPWTLAQVDLSSFAGQDIQLRFRFGSDQGTNLEGWYVDDVSITAFANLVDPTGLTVYQFGTNLVLRWNDDINPAYKVYSDTTPDGTFSTLEGSTTGTQFTIPGGADQLMKFFLVRGWDGN